MLLFRTLQITSPGLTHLPSHLKFLIFSSPSSIQKTIPLPFSPLPHILNSPQCLQCLHFPHYTSPYCLPRVLSPSNRACSACISFLISFLPLQS